MIPLAIPNLDGNEEAYLRDCVATNFVSSVGPYVDRFEQMVAEQTGAVKAIATCSGTTGLHAALTAVGVGHGDLVILPALTFIASANAISHCGAMPWLFDIDAESWTLDTDALKHALETDTERRDGTLIHKATGKRVAAIMPVYTMGLPARMDVIVPLAREYGLPVVADSAAALGARMGGRNIAELGADLSVLSFNGNKTVTSGGGGAVIGSDEALCARVKHLTTTARSGPDYTHDQVGFNYRMTNIAAAVGCAQLERLDHYVGRKKQVAAFYTQHLSDLPGMGRFPSPAWATSADWFSGVIVRDPDRIAPEALVAKLREAGIDARSFWKPMYLQPPYESAPKTPMPVTDAIWRNVIVLPCSTSITDDQLDHIATSFKSAVAQLSQDRG